MILHLSRERYPRWVFRIISTGKGPAIIEIAGPSYVARFMRETEADYRRPVYGRTFSQKRMSIVAISARVALPPGTMVVVVLPVMIPCATAHSI